jgi:hypothetical protein
MTYRLIAHQELASAQASITFGSIPQTFTDLVLVTSLRGANYCGILPNGSNANTSYRILWGLNGSAITSNYTSFSYNIFSTVAISGSTASTFGNTSIYFPNYRSSSNKSVSVDSVNENNSATAEQLLGIGLWNNTAAISSITLTSLDANLNAGSNFAIGSSATLYGITAGTSGGVTVS